MIRQALILTVALLISVTSAVAQSKSVRPVERPDRNEPKRPEFAVFITDKTGLTASLRPIARPTISTKNAPRAVKVAPSPSVAALTRSARPVIRPKQPKQSNVVKASFAKATPTPKLSRSRKGSVCGSRTIRGQKIRPVVSRVTGCGIGDPVQITSVDGVALSQPSTMDCQTATALESWVKNGIKPAVGKRGGGVASLKVVAHYSCRPRNNKKGAKISEHGKGHALDIAAINLQDGESLTVLKGWRSKSQSSVLRKIHASACGPFGTVLGPKSDKYHQDHFHVDTARYRSGPYCR
ncbi:MAG: extensin-like domain-containing protein [Marinosulfonomonas sp.]